MPLRRVLALLVVLGLVVAACSGGGDPGSVGTPTTTTGPTTTAPTTTTPFEGTMPPPTSVTPLLPPPRVALPRPLRAAWVHLFDDSLKTAAGMEKVLDEAEAAGLDALFVQVVRRHDAYYSSLTLPPTPDPGLEPGFDVLAAAIEGGKRRGVQIHAWFTVATASHRLYADLVFPPGHITREHGPGSADPWMTVSHTGRRSTDYFDVGLREVQDHVAAVVADIASRYAVDGIHLDYARYDGPEWGYHPSALTRFAAETGRRDVPAVDDRAWSDWRRAQSRAIVERARTALDETRPQALLSAAVIAQGRGPVSAPGGFSGTRAYADYLQDWPGWIADGLADLVVPMVYMREHVAEQARWYREWVSFAADLDAAHADAAVAVGIGGWLNTAPNVLLHAREALARTAGAVIFSYQQDSSDAPRGALLRQFGAG